MRCDLCRAAGIKRGAVPACAAGRCPTGYDLLPPAALRILEIRALLTGLADLNLAGRVCDEYGVGLADMRWLAEIEALLRELHPPKKTDER